MKKVLLTQVFIALTLLGLAQDMTTVKLSGKITNPSSDTILIKNGWGEEFHLMTLAKDGTFSTEFEIETGYYRLSDLNESTTIYLGENYDLDITLDTDSFDESITYKGKGADANNYLAKKALMEESWGRLNYYGYYCKLEEKAFLKLTDSLFKVELGLLNKTKITDSVFFLLASEGINNEKSYKLKTYPGTYRILTRNKEYIKSKDYPYPFENFNINNSKLITAPQYISTVISYLYYHRDTSIYSKTDDYTQYLIEAIRDSISNDDVKINAMHYFCRSRLTKAKNLDYCFNIYKNIETDPKRLKLIENKYLARKKTQKRSHLSAFCV